MTTCTDELFVGDIGTSIEFYIRECDDSDPDNPVSIPVDISTATLLEVIFLKPDQSTFTVEGELVTDPDDSLMRYITLAGELDLAGPWKSQAKITMPTGLWHTSTVSFKVKDPLSI